MKQKLKIGLVGCGAIGSYLAKTIERLFKKQARLVAICDIKEKSSRHLKKSLQFKPAICSESQVINRSELIIEATNVSSCLLLLEKVIAKRKDILVMSTGAFLKGGGILEKAKKRGVRIYVPSGAIVGIDALKAASMGKIYNVTLTTRKPIKGLEGAPFIRKKRINLRRIKHETVIFEGTPQQAIEAFPKNINVAATVSLCLGVKITPQVRIITSPTFKRNIHELEIIGDFGRIVSRAENIPSSANPKTSYLAMLSASATLKSILATLKLGA